MENKKTELDTIEPLSGTVLHAILDKASGSSQIGRTVDGEFVPFDGVKIETVIVRKSTSKSTAGRITLTDSERPAGKTGIQLPERNEHDHKRFESAAEDAIAEEMRNLLDITTRPVPDEHVKRWAEDLLKNIMALHETHIGGL